MAGLNAIAVVNVPGSGLNQRGSNTMAEQEDDRNVPVMQRILDNPFILLFIGILIPTMTYIIWGVMELISVPIAD